MKFFEGEEGGRNMQILIGGLFFCTFLVIAVMVGRYIAHSKDLIVVHTEEPVFTIEEHDLEEPEIDWDSIEITEISLDDVGSEFDYTEPTTNEEVKAEEIISDTEEAVVVQEETYLAHPDIKLDPKLQDFTRKKCEEYSVSYPLILALMETESSFDKRIGEEKILGGEEGGARYYGYMQLSASNCKKAKENGIDAHTPEGNIEWGIKLIADYIKKYGEYEAVITAYKCGEGTADSGKRLNCEKLIDRTMEFSEMLGVD